MIARSRALHRALSFLRFSTSLSPLFLSFSTLYYPDFLRFVFLFYLVHHQVSNHLPFGYIALTSLSSTPLHYEIQLSFIPPKLIFILLDALAWPKINITIYLFICLMFAACCMKTCITFAGRWRRKSEGDDFFLSPNFD